MTRPRRGYALLACLSGLLACKPGPNAETQPRSPAGRNAVRSAEAATLLEPPPAREAPHVPFPTIHTRRLKNGLPLRVVERRFHPLIELRLVVRSGSTTDGDDPGLALLAGEMLKAGGAGRFEPLQLVEAAESLGTNLEVRTGRDATTIALNVTTGNLDPALEILSAVALHPRFRPRELQLLKAREIGRVKSLARGSAAWAASMVLYRELYAPAQGVHPYARYDALPSEIEKVSLGACRAWHQAHFVPANASLVVVGDVTADGILAATAKWFAPWKGRPAPEPRFPRPLPEAERHVYLVDRPGSAQAQILVGLLGPERQSRQWPALTVINQILGGGVSGRLFLDVREQRSLAYATGSSLVEPRVGPAPMILSAGTQTPKAAEAVRALLEHLEAVTQRTATEAEVERAKTFLTDSFLLQLETVGGIAELTHALEVLGLPDDHYDEYRAAVRALGVREVNDVAGKQYDGTPVVVVAGDAAILGEQLEAFGPVTVLEAERASQSAHERQLQIPMGSLWRQSGSDNRSD